MATTRVLVWGNNQENLLSPSHSQCLTKPEEITIPYAISTVSASQKHISFITLTGQVYSFGNNIDGRLGVGKKQGFKCTFQNSLRVPLITTCQQLQCGFSHVCARLSNNQIYAWGLGDYGALGIGQFKSKNIPSKVLVTSNIKTMSCGAMHTAFLDYEGNIYMCGSNEYGQLGIKSPSKIGTPIYVALQERVKQAVCGVFYSLVLTESGYVYGMGNNKYGQLGLGHKINESTPALIKQLSGIVCVQAGYHSGALDSAGLLYIWGSGSFGQFLRPKKFNVGISLTKLQIKGFFGLTCNQTDRKVFVWGNNTHGQLGNGGYMSYKQPTQMKQISGVPTSNIFCGINFAIVLLNDHKKNSKNKVTFQRNYQRSYSPIQNSFTQRRFDEYQNPRRQLSQSKSIKYEKDALSLPISRKRSPQKNYELLFIDLSRDYQILAKKYSVLQQQIQERQLSRSRRQADYLQSQTRKQIMLRQELAFYESQLNITKQELKISLKKIDNLTQEMRVINDRQIRNLQVQKEISEQYKKIIVEKDKYISDLELIRSKYQGKIFDFQSHHAKAENDKKYLETQLQLTKGQTNKLGDQIRQLKLNLQSLSEQNYSLKKKSENQKNILVKFQQERTKQYQFIEEMKNNQAQEKKIAGQKIAEERNKASLLNEKVKQLQNQISYQKQFSKQLQQGKNQLQKLRVQACNQLKILAQTSQKQKTKIKQLNNEIQKGKIVKKQLQTTKNQLQKQRIMTQEYRQKMNAQYRKKQVLIKEMEKEMQSKQSEFNSILQKKEEEIQRQTATNKDTNKKLQNQKNQNKRLMKEIANLNEQIQNFKDRCQKYQRKVKHLKEEMQKQIHEREELTEEVGRLKRQQTKSQLQKEELQKRITILQSQKKQVEALVKRKQEAIQDLQGQIKQMKERIQNMKTQNAYMRSELDQANAAVQQTNRISQELSNANKEFAQNQQNFTKQIQELQSRVYELQDQNRSYAPRYDALIQRNRELDERNKELSEMVNKAIQIQAENYKNHILKEVQINTNQIINDANEQQIFKQRFNRRPEPQQEPQKSSNHQNSFNKTPQVVSRVRQEPYTKYMNEKIQTHRRRVSESAQKLAGILNLDNANISQIKKQGSGFATMRHDQDYQKINDQMQSLKSQKEAFMEKINSFASKMKLL